MSVVNSTADGLRRTGRLPALEHGLELPGGDAQSASEFDTARQLLSYLSGSVRNLDEALPQARPAPPGHRAPSHARHSRRLIHSGPVLSEITLAASFTAVRSSRKFHVNRSAHVS